MRSIFLTYALLSALLTHAQVFSSRLYSDEKGLHQKFIFSIEQDSNGVLLLATENGIISYNGDFFAPAAPVTSLAEKQVATVFCDSRGTTWAGHFQSGLSCVQHSIASVADSSASMRGRINSMDEDANGCVWGVADGHGLFYVQPVTRKVQMAPGGELTSGRVKCYRNRLFVAGEDGLRVYEAGSDYSVKLLSVLPETQNRNITALCVAQLFGTQMLFAAAEGDGIYYYTLNGNQVQCVGKLGSEIVPVNAQVSAIACDQFNVLWIGTMGDGLTKAQFISTLVPYQVEHYTSAAGLPDDNVQSLLVDEENNLWIGTFGSGLVQIPYSVFRYYTTANGLIRPEVNCVVKDRSHTLWIGTNSGITKFDRNEPTKHFDAKSGFISSKVSCLATDTAGLIWIGTAGNGIYCLDPLTERFVNISQQHNLHSLFISGIICTPGGEIFAGTSDGLYIFRDTRTAPEYLTTMDGLAHNNIHYLYPDAANNVWFASDGSPPYKMHGRQVSLVRDTDHAKIYSINSICPDGGERQWLATEGDGVIALSQDQAGNVHIQQAYSTAQGLSSDHCIAAVTDNYGVLWVVHQSGVSMKFPEDSGFYSFLPADNRLFEHLNPSAYRDQDGVVYFCSQSGLIEVSTASREYLRRDPRISLSNLFINGSERFTSNNIQLDAGSYNLTFEFNTILFGANHATPYYYRILGADTVWRSASGRSIVIPQLSSGEYVLQVAPSRQAIGRGDDPLAVNISIDYPFWQKTGFIVAMIFLVPVIVYSIIRVRTLSLVKMNQRLHVLVKEKTGLLEAEKESVARINVELQQKTKDITDSIQYAKRIQLAILPDLDILRKNFPESFVFYQPRDIVSGDFYWLAERDDLLFIAAADCTGHGVPGAFMSMISTTLINKVVFDLGVTRPSSILQSLNSEIKSSLHQQQSSESSHDGLDIALCVIDRRSNVLRFSGAGRPLLHIRNGEITVHKTNKGGLGGVYSKTSPVFDEVRIEMQTGDCFYMYSDGYTDQFGGANQHKFSSPALRALLKLISPLSMRDQEERLRAAFETWKGSEEQCDDVLVIGMKIC